MKMTDPNAAKKPDPTKGKQYRAVSNISFGKDRKPVAAGEVFNLDDDAQAKDLLAKGVITANVKATPAPERTAEQINQGEPANAAKVRGDAAEEAAGASAGGTQAAAGAASGAKNKT
jgi:hypothetical protein